MLSVQSQQAFATSLGDYMPRHITIADELSADPRITEVLETTQYWEGTSERVAAALAC